MNNYAHTEIYKGHLIVVEWDEDPMSPMEWDNFGKMVCWHRNYNLGHEQPSERPNAFIRSLLYNVPNIENHPTYLVWAERVEAEWGNNLFDVCLETWLEDNTTNEELWELFSQYYYNLPLYLYNHSGITISTSSFSCPWDSGQVGFIYVSKDDAKKEFPEDTDTKSISLLKSEVETYADYLTNNVYGYRIFEVPADFDDDEFDEDYFDLDDFGDPCDSLWGIYPDHSDRHDYDEALQDAKSYVDWLVKDNFNKDMEKASEQEVVE